MRTIMAVAAVGAALRLTAMEPQSVVTVAQGDGWRSNLDPPSAAVSADGRYIAFTSYVGLVPADGNQRRDVYVLDCADGRITLESLTPAGGVSDVDSTHPGISADGATVVYETTISADGVISLGVVLRDRRLSTAQVIGGGSRDRSDTGWSGFPAISGDGQVVAFASTAVNLVGGTNGSGSGDVFVFDRRGRGIRRVSVGLDARRGEGAALRNVAPSLSADGRYVAFTSVSSSGGGRRSVSHVYLRDTHLNTTRRISGDRAPTPSDLPSWDAAVSANGRYVVFVSEATTLAAHDRNRSQDVFLYDVHDRSTVLVSRSVRGGSGNGRSANPAISADGRFIVFQSEASDLICAERCAPADEDINLLWDVFLFDRQTGMMKRLSGDASEGWMEASGGPALDASGGIVTFSSRHAIDASDTRNDFDLFVWTAPRSVAAGDHQARCAAAFRASARTASTIDISPIPLPIEMFWRKIRSTMDVSMRAISSG